MQYSLSITQMYKISRISHQDEPEVLRSRLDQPLGNAPGSAPTSQTQAKETQLFSCLNYKGVFTHRASQIYPPSSSAFPQVQHKNQHLCPCSNSPGTCLASTWSNWPTPIPCSQCIGRGYKYTVYYAGKMPSIVNLVHSSITSSLQHSYNHVSDLNVREKQQFVTINTHNLSQ